ncbi:hypothetical protein OBBRIDRAFT_839549 [Obba rivulosa]|uniref:Uncharacterized protein n=1 Tax=Obba rivulosa TaxID=1052685 RepID=A0A8E2ASW9_9APHY|nr:hypothetical protein OBBRIDRAFT_839549 [Obba rivulosa]
MDERSNDLFFATVVEESRDPRHVVLMSRSTIQPEPSALPPEALSLDDVLEGICAVRWSIPLRASPTNKREAHRTTVTAQAQLSHVEEHLCRLSSSLASPSKELLSDAERDLHEISKVVSSIRRVTPSLDQRSSAVQKSLEHVQAHILELRNLYLEETEPGPVFHDSDHHYHVPVNEYHVVAQIAMFLGIVLHVLGKASRTMSDFLLSGLSLLVGLSFEVSPSPSSAGLTPEQGSILAQIPCNLKMALERFNLSARTKTYAACPRCHFVYDPIPDIHSGGMTYQEICTNVPELGGSECREPLLKSTSGMELAATPR